MFLFFLIFSNYFVNSQTSDDQYKKPLKEVIAAIETRFNVKIRYTDDMVNNKWVTYAEWRFRPDLEKTLTNVLTPLDLTFRKEGEGKYKLKYFEYYRWTYEDGKEMAEYLSSKYNNLRQWESRRDSIIPCLWSALKLEKIPPKPSSSIIMTPKRNMEGYSVENFAIETLSGLYVCGSIYKPAKIKGKIPAMICPNGHWKDGRYRPDQQYQCAMLARLGCISVSYDLFAWGESLLQFKEEDHHHSLAMTIQVLNTLRIIDYITSLPYVDTTRVGITGGSGAGSHAMLISAIDKRIKLSVPAVMLSCYMYGGCPCESGMPIHLCGGFMNNIELAGMSAPKPQLIISDGKDWTEHVPDIEFPLLKRIYKFYNDTSVVENAHFPDEGHDYGISKRIALYNFVAKHFCLNIEKIKDVNGNIDESKVTIEEFNKMFVFGNNGEKLPLNAIKSFDELEKIFEKASK